MTKRRRHRYLLVQQLSELRHDLSAMIGLGILVGITVLGLLAPRIAPFPPSIITLDALAAPSREHWFGTDELGRDVLSRVLYGARISPTVGLIAAGISAGVGVPLGLIAGYSRGVADGIVMRLMDVLLAFPGIVLAIAIVAVLGPGLDNALIAVGIGGIPYFARVVRASVLVEREKEYVSAARMSGHGGVTIVCREILPNILAPVIVLSTLAVAGAILAASALSFIGLGAQLPSPEWGAMLSQGRDYLAEQWWLATFPGVAIAVTVIAVNLVGDGLRGALDPRLRG